MEGIADRDRLAAARAGMEAGGIRRGDGDPRLGRLPAGPGVSRRPSHHQSAPSDALRAGTCLAFVRGLGTGLVLSRKRDIAPAVTVLPIPAGAFFGAWLARQGRRSARRHGPTRWEGPARPSPPGPRSRPA